MMQEEVLRCVELLDIDEAIIDQRLKVIMSRETHNEKQLSNAVLLLRYKLLINQQENDDCDNDEELVFAAKLLPQIDEHNVSFVCKIYNLILNLNKSTLVGKSEHLLQQILSDLFSSPEGDLNSAKELLRLKICDSILDAVVAKGMKASLLFLEAPIDKILCSKDENLKKHFLISTVPGLVYGVVGYDVLDKILTILRNYKEEQTYEALKILICLTDFYIPKFGEKLWRMIRCGLNSTDVNQRKLGIYLAKRSVENSDPTISIPKTHWDNYFVLMESLEEKQSNIVLPSLQLFESLEPHLGKPWLVIPFSIGLRHENTQVKKRCIELRLKVVSIESTDEARELLASINDIHLFSNAKEAEVLLTKLKSMLENNSHYLKILQTIPTIQWSPVPFYYIMSALLPAALKEDFVSQNKDTIIQSVSETLKLQCNNISIKKFMQVQMMKLVIQMSKQMDWRIVLKVLSIPLKEDKDFSSFIPQLNRLLVTDDDETEFHKFITSSTLYIQKALKYFIENNKFESFFDVFSKKISKIKDINSREYSRKMDCFDDYIFLVQLFDETLGSDSESPEERINKEIQKEAKTLASYLLNILADDAVMTIHDPKDLETAASYMHLCIILELNEIVHEIYKTAFSIVTNENNNDLARKVLSLKLIEILADPQSNNLKLGREDDLEFLLKLRLNVKGLNHAEKSSKMKNEFYETNGKLVCLLLEATKIKKSTLKQFEMYIDHYTECGGDNCIYLVVKAVTQSIDRLNSGGFDVMKFIERVWREMEEMKGTTAYNYCMAEFTTLILHDAVIGEAKHNNVVLYYFNKLMELGRSNASLDPLFHFVCSLDEKQINMGYGNLVHFLQEILMFSPVVKKELKITESIANTIISTCGLRVPSSYSVQTVQGMVLTTLFKITDTRVHEAILDSIMKKIDETFRNRDRYHADSQPHKTILIGVQHMLFYALIETKLMVKTTVDWSVKLLAKLPHQPSVRTCLEWYIALYIIAKKLPINEETVKELNLSLVPQTSQLLILYHAMNHRIRCDLYKNEEYDFTIQFLLAHSMGPAFNVRLHAQFLALNTYKNAKPDLDIHEYTMNIVERTLQEGSNEKSFIKLRNDIFANKFDVISNLTPHFIYKFLPKYFGVATAGESDIVPRNDECRKYMLDKHPDDILKSWMLYCLTDGEIDQLNIDGIEEASEGVKIDEVGDAIQKKYIPWRNMNGVGYGDNVVKKEITSELIIVASLIDKLPNLGGLARTSEVFGVKTYVVPSLAKLKDPQFQGLSVSAERWVDIQEVRPGQPLKTYLMLKRSEGYSIVAAEQTSGSVPLQGFKFPKKTVLVLGHEKNGIPCDLLPLMDTCVEVPQSGFVRSLNVHVTAAIFVWEYSRQNML